MMFKFYFERFFFFRKKILFFAKMHLFQLIAHTGAQYRIVVDLTIPKSDAPLFWIKSCGTCLNQVNTYILQKPPMCLTNALSVPNESEASS